jgi:hypothetical protein
LKLSTWTKPGKCLGLPDFEIGFWNCPYSIDCYTNEMMGKWKMKKRKISKNDIEKYIYIDFWSQKINTVPGYQCLACPLGYKGNYEDGLTWNNTVRVFELMNQELSPIQDQMCFDIDECQTDNGGCDSLSPCVNTIVWFCWTNYWGKLCYFHWTLHECRIYTLLPALERNNSL